MIIYITLYAILSAYIAFRMTWFKGMNDFAVFLTLMLLWPAFLVLYKLSGKRLTPIFKPNDRG